MITMLTRRNFSLLCLAFLLPLAWENGGCRKLLAAPAPSDNIDASSIYSTDAGAQSAMMGFYNSAMDNTQGLLNGSISLYAALSADELSCVNPFLPEDSFYINRLTASNTLSANLFSSAYTLLYGLN